MAKKGKKQTGIVRTTISIPRRLKAAMDEVTEPVNWSAVAARAFESRLAEIAARKKEKTMADVVNRLRESKKRSEDATHSDGESRGRDWAMRQADTEALSRLEELYDSLQGHEWEWSFQDEGSAYSPRERLMFVIDPETKNDRQAAGEGWQQITGEENDETRSHPDFVRGFADGALAVWSEVKDRL